MKGTNPKSITTQKKLAAVVREWFRVIHSAFRVKRTSLRFVRNTECLSRSYLFFPFKNLNRNLLWKDYDFCSSSCNSMLVIFNQKETTDVRRRILNWFQNKIGHDVSKAILHYYRGLSGFCHFCTLILSFRG